MTQEAIAIISGLVSGGIVGGLIGTSTEMKRRALDVTTSPMTRIPFGMAISLIMRSSISIIFLGATILLAVAVIFYLSGIDHLNAEQLKFFAIAFLVGAITAKYLRYLYWKRG
ncbi:MAG TPA: hypothetical protein VLV50_10245 [Stellaceae bacterium]|nr:hypothetical protein [Stellaceae bacterium]